MHIAINLIRDFSQSRVLIASHSQEIPSSLSYVHNCQWPYCQIYCRTFATRSRESSNSFNRIIDFARLRNFMLRTLSSGEPYMNGICFRLNCANYLPCAYWRNNLQKFIFKTTRISFFNLPLIMPRLTKLARESVGLSALNFHIGGSTIS